MCPKYAMELHEISENALKTEKIKKLISYMKNYTSSPLNTLYDVLKVADVIMTQVRNSDQ